MARPVFLLFAALLVCPAGAKAANLCDAAQQRAGQPPAPGKTDGRGGDHDHAPRPKWWIDAKLRAELGVTDQQSAAVEKIWQAATPELRDIFGKLQKMEEDLTRLTNDDGADEKAVIAEINRVEDLRADANKRRTTMIYRMHRILTPDQRAKVEAMYERRDPPRRGPSSR